MIKPKYWEVQNLFGNWLILDTENNTIVDFKGNEENAKLAASAPEIQRMLKMFVNAIEGCEPNENGTYTQTFGPAMLNEAKRILNKK